MLRLCFKSWSASSSPRSAYPFLSLVPLMTFQFLLQSELHPIVPFDVTSKEPSCSSLALLFLHFQVHLDLKLIPFGNRSSSLPTLLCCDSSFCLLMLTVQFRGTGQEWNLRDTSLAKAPAHFGPSPLDHFTNPAMSFFYCPTCSDFLSLIL